MAAETPPIPTPTPDPTPDADLEGLLAGLEKTLEHVARLGVTEEEEKTFTRDPFAGIAGTDHLAAVRPGVPAVTADKIKALRKAVREAKTSKERMAEVVAYVASALAGVAKGLAK